MHIINCNLLSKTLLPIIFVLLFSACAVTHNLYLTSKYRDDISPSSPDYSLQKNWASLPSKLDSADAAPDSEANNQDSAKVDVFFIHPTTYLNQQNNDYAWNADVSDDEINLKTDKTTIKFQASVFNGSCKVYAPRYRQAHISAYYSKDLDSRKKSLALAYSDVLSSFKYYLDHYNNNRPFIVASHSQGTTHAQKIIKDVIENDSLLLKRFICAYVVGMPVPKDSFEVIKPCTQPDDLQCYCSWSTFASGYYPPWYNYSQINAQEINPISFTTDTNIVSRDYNQGGVLQDFKIKPKICDAKIHKGMIWIHKPKIRGAKLIRIKNYHIGDYNLFYMNIRKNVETRVNKYLEVH
jgi:hypothetical protein